MLEDMLLPPQGRQTGKVREGCMKRDMVVIYMIRGVLAILCGGMILFVASPTTPSLAIVFSAYCLLDGIATFLLALGGVDKKDPRWYLMGESVVNIAAGLAILIFAGVFGFLFPRVSAVLLLLLLSARISLIGLFELLVGIFRKNAAPQFRIPIGLSSAIFGLIMIYLHDRGILAFISPIGIYAIVSGVFLILACSKLKDRNTGGSSVKM